MTNDFLQQIADYEIERSTALESGKPALMRLMNIAAGDTGQCIVVRNFLLGLYNGSRFKFNLNKLRGLDKTLFDDCMAVLTMDCRATVKEVHQYISNGSDIFENWAKTHEPE